MSTPDLNPAPEGGSNGASNAWNSLHLTSILDAAKTYTAMGLKVIPVHAPVVRDDGVRCTCGCADCTDNAGKHPVHKSWVKMRLGESDLATHFGLSERRNLGVLLGEPSGGIADTDIDCIESLMLAPAFLPATPCRYGRASNPDSHHWYRITPAIKSVAFKDTNGKTLVEIRSTGLQTVAPPSLHQSGEMIAFSSQDAPAAIDGAVLKRRVAHLAAASLVLRGYPRQKGGRWRRVHALAGGLLRADWPLDQVMTFIHAIASAAGDDEIDARMEGIKQTAEKMAKGEEVTGWPVLGELIGHDAVQLVLKYLGIKPGRASSWQEKTPRTRLPLEERYGRNDLGLIHQKETQVGPVAVQLSNFMAKIIADVTEDDGVEKRRVFELEAQLGGGEPVRFTVSADEFADPKWAIKHLGAKAIVYPGNNASGHTIAAIQTLSTDIQIRTVYTHSGWRKIDGAFVYLHAGGAIGEDGPVAGIETLLPDPLMRLLLPPPPSGDALAAAAHAVLHLLTLGPALILYPSVACVFRAVIGGADFSMFDVGPTGTFKSELSALQMQFFGAGFDARHLPASWSSTANTNEEMAFRAKDACLVVDDFKPSGDTGGDAKLHQAADRLLRAQGNHCGRGRMKADGSLRAVRPPRGMIISTGEELPRGHSLRARTFINEITPGSIDLTKLTQCQKDAARGLYAEFLSAFIAWLAPRVEQVQARFKARVDAVRGEFTGDHARTSPMLAELYVAFDMMIEFIVEATGEQVLTAAEGAREIGFCSDALKASGSVQSMLQGQADPVARYFELISSALASGRAHVAGSDGNAPRDPAKWGWRLEQEGAREVYRPMGDRIGWVEDGDLYLEALAAHRTATVVAGNDPLSVGERTLAKRLHERGYLLSVEKGRGTHRIRKVLDGGRRAVLHLSASAISESAEDSGEALV